MLIHSQSKVLLTMVDAAFGLFLWFVIFTSLCWLVTPIKDDSLHQNSHMNSEQVKEEVSQHEGLSDNTNVVTDKVFTHEEMPNGEIDNERVNEELHLHSLNLKVDSLTNKNMRKLAKLLHIKVTSNKKYKPLLTIKTEIKKRIVSDKEAVREALSRIVNVA